MDVERSLDVQVQKNVVTLPLLVRNRTGYQNLCRLITLMKLRVPKHAKPGECAVTPDELAAHAEGLICLTGGSDGPLAKDIHRRDAENAEMHRELLNGWLMSFGKGKCLCRVAAPFQSR